MAFDLTQCPGECHGGGQVSLGQRALLGRGMKCTALERSSTIVGKVMLPSEEERRTHTL